MSHLNKTQVGGTHYTSKTVQPWEAMQSWMSHDEFTGFLRGNVIKYIARCNEKGGIEDLKKARHYLDKLTEVLTHQSQQDEISTGHNVVITAAMQTMKEHLASRYPKIDIVAGNCLHIVINANPSVDKPSFEKEVVAIVLDVERECRCVSLKCLDMHVNQRQSQDPPIAVFVFGEIK